ncbi:MAG: sigma-70 family RNA polymerase sigma factor [Bacteroidia bacterium]
MENWDVIYKNNASKLLGVCRRYINDEQLAEDLMHNAFITAMNKISTYSGSGLFEAWLRKIVVNTVLLYLRESKKMQISDTEQIENHPISDSETESEQTQKKIIEEAGFSQQELLEIVDKLPLHHKTVFNLYVIDGYTHNEIGDLLKISGGTSKSHLARARKKIQELLLEKAKRKIQ